MTIQAVAVGSLGRDPEQKTTQNGYSLVSFSLAVQENSRIQFATWYDVTVWGSIGDDVLKMVKKGDTAVVTGTIEHRPWTNKDGEKKVSLGINAKSVTKVGLKTVSTDDRQHNENSQKPSQSQAPVSDSEIPF